MTREGFDAVDEALRVGLESTLSAAGARYRVVEQRQPEHVVTYVVETRDDSGLRLSLELVADQLSVLFNGCVVFLQYAAHVPKFGRNPTALADWRSECLDTVRALLTSDLRISIRAWGDRVLGGFLWRRERDRWISVGGGGSLLMFLGVSRTREYRDWLAR